MMHPCLNGRFQRVPTDRKKSEVNEEYERGQCCGVTGVVTAMWGVKQQDLSLSLSLFSLSLTLQLNKKSL